MMPSICHYILVRSVNVLVLVNEGLSLHEEELSTLLGLLLSELNYESFVK